MNLRSLLNLHLKSDEVMELLDFHEIDVVYDFDRLHEGTPDVYWASSAAAGFELRFDHRQVLDTVFLHVREREGFRPANEALADVPFHLSPREAHDALSALGATVVRSPDGTSWVRGDLADHSRHYEFSAQGELSLVTLTLIAPVWTRIEAC